LLWNLRLSLSVSAAAPEPDKRRNIWYKVQTMDAIQEMQLTKANFFGAAYPRQSRNELICVTANSSKGAAN